MLAFDLRAEQEFSDIKHVEKILGIESGGDVTVACWEPGQVSPNHCHPQATEIYLCLEGRGHMNVNGEQIAIEPGTFILHPPGEIHEYVNGDQRTVLFRVRYGENFASKHIDKTQPLASSFARFE